jgi:hypothetical protein
VVSCLPIQDASDMTVSFPRGFALELEFRKQALDDGIH